MIKVFIIINTLSIIVGYFITYYFLVYVCQNEDCGWGWWFVYPSLTIVIYLIVSLILQKTKKPFESKKSFFMFLGINILLAVIFTILTAITIFRYMYFDLGLRH